MIRLTVLYNLAADTDEEEFLAWRLGEHQEYNSSMPGVVRTDFGRVYNAWPEGKEPRYRFMTTADFPDRQSFEKAFYDEEIQTKLKADSEGLGDYLFLISEILTSTDE